VGGYSLFRDNVETPTWQLMEAGKLEALAMRERFTRGSDNVTSDNVSPCSHFGLPYYNKKLQANIKTT